MTTITKTYEGIQTAYNRSEIMKTAHELKKILGCTMSVALTKAWKAAKAAQRKALANVAYFNDTVTVRIDIWAKYGKVRGYMMVLKTNPNDKKTPCWFDCGSYVNLAA